MKRDNSINWTYKDPSHMDLKSFNVAIIGGTGGIGRAISRALALCGANVIVVGQTFKDDDVKGIKFVKANLTSINEAKRVASELPVENLDIALFTTGIFAAPKREETTEGLERDMAVSYLNRLAMLRIIVPRLKKEKNAAGFLPRVFIMGFPGTNKLGAIDDLNHEKSYGVMSTHMSTVAGNEALVIDSKNRYKEVHFYGLNPGLIRTNIRSNYLGEGTLKYRIVEWTLSWFTQTADSYAKKIVPLFFTPDIEKYSGTMFNNQGHAIIASEGMTSEYAQKYIIASEKLLKSKGIEV